MELVELDTVSVALGLGISEHVAIVGGGGKTTILHALGRQLKGSVVMTTTTKMGHDQAGGRPLLLDPDPAKVLSAAHKAAISPMDPGPIMVWSAIEGQKAVGVQPEDCDQWFRLVDSVVIEADGSRRRPFKAPAPYEPVVPLTATTMISVIGAPAIGGVIAEVCHRPSRAASIIGTTPSARLTPKRAAQLLLDDRGPIKELPDGARYVIVATQVRSQSAFADVSAVNAHLQRLLPETLMIGVR